MAIYHCSVKVISRGQGRSSVGAAAYRSGEKIHNERDGLIHDYTKKTGVEHKEVLAPEQAPKWVHDRNKLWNEVEKAEKRINSRTAREIEIALPNELSREQQIDLLRDYVKNKFVSKGMVADMVIHDKEDGNPHAHIMLTTRHITKEGFTTKERKWDKKEQLEKWREKWANYANKHLEKAGHKERIDHRSYEDQGIEKLPTKHLGVSASAMEKRGVQSEKGNINREIQKQNEQLKQIQKQIEEYNKKIIKLEEQRKLEDRAKEEQRKTEEREKAERKTLEEQRKKEQDKQSDKPKTERKVDLDKVKEKYIEVKKMYNNLMISQGKLNDEIRKNQRQIKDIGRAKEEIQNYDRDIEKLKQDHKKTNIFQFKKRKEIQKQIDGLEQGRENIYKIIDREYGIKDRNMLETISSKIENNNEIYNGKLQEIKQGIEKVNNISKLYERDYILGIAQRKIEQYKNITYTENVLEEPHIKDNVNNLSDRLYDKKNLKDRLTYIRDTKVLNDRITLKDVEKIADKLMPQDREILINGLQKDEIIKERLKISSKDRDR